MSATTKELPSGSTTATHPVDGKPLRVCHLSLTLKTGGLERLLADMARLHDPRRLILEYVSFGETGRFADEIRAAGCPVFGLNPAGKLGQMRQLAKLFRDRKFDVLHTHNTYPHIWGTIAARWSGIPVVVNTRHGQRLGHSWKSQIPYRLGTWLADRVVTVSDDAAAMCLNVDRLPEGKVQRIWNGIDIDQFAWSGPGAEPIAISVGRLSAEKDFPTLLRATSIAIQAFPDLRVWIVGDGPERAKLESLATELNLNRHVKFWGERHDIPDLLSQAAFYVSSSLSEGISLTLLEAMAVGLPVIATAVGGNPEIVVDGETGYLSPVGNAEELGHAMVALAEQPGKWLPLAQAGRERVAKHFEVRRMIDDYVQLYHDLLQTKSRG